MTVFSLPGPHLTLSILSPDQAELVRRYYLENRDHLEPWEPSRDESFYSLSAIETRLRTGADAFADGTSFSFAVIDNESGRMIGICNFSNIVRGVFQACHLGFAIDVSFQGRGMMFEAVKMGIKYMFDEVGLHRIMANYLPDNERSARLLTRLGFEREGYARAYLKIARRWQDHVLTALINPNAK